MKKNVMMRVASVLLIAVMMTTCAISGTFAKYVTSGESTDSARVAKWGVKITANGDTFANEYDKDDGSFTLAAKSVISQGGVDVVAPGTDGTMAAMALTGVPEVAVRVSYTGTFDVSDKWKDSSDNFYCPLVIKVNGTPVYGYACGSALEFENAVNALINSYSRDYTAGTDLSGVGGDALVVTWEWPFEGDNVKDTYLGDQANDGNAAEVTLTVKTTVTQID